MNAAPRDLQTEMFAYCGLSSRAVGNLDAVLEQDSQAGTPLSRASAGEASVSLPPEHIDQLCRHISEYSPKLRAEMILPGTYALEIKQP